MYLITNKAIFFLATLLLTIVQGSLTILCSVPRIIFKKFTGQIPSKTCILYKNSVLLLEFLWLNVKLQIIIIKLYINYI